MLPGRGLNPGGRGSPAAAPQSIVLVRGWLSRGVSLGCRLTIHPFGPRDTCSGPASCALWLSYPAEPCSRVSAQSRVDVYEPIPARHRTSQ